VAHTRHPAWWLKRLRRDWPSRWQQQVEAGNQHPPMCLRVNRRKADRATAQARLQASGVASRPIGEDALLLETPCPVNQLDGFAQGWLSVQDAGAQHAPAWLAAEPGMRVLDACAAPGGKTAHLLEHQDLSLVALDIDGARLDRVRENLDRLDLKACLIQGDCQAPQDWWDGQPFDRILADLPCSASGVVRRHPDIKWLRRDQDIARFAAQQAAMLEALWPLLSPGGALLYVTCSVFREENQDQISRFLAHHPDAHLCPIEGQADQALCPDATQDGFYYARLEKHARTA
jgi:16S rRNA (cytosine967-C5)-methyltransferase